MLFKILIKDYNRDIANVDRETILTNRVSEDDNIQNEDVSKTITPEKHDSSEWQPQEHVNINDFSEEAKEDVDKVED